MSSFYFQKPKGTQDFFGDKLSQLRVVESTFYKICQRFNFKLFVTPLFEQEALIRRSVGADCDVVNKELYQFKDKNGRELVLRPEGTAPLIRAFIENKLYHQPKRFPHKYAYFGKMYRYEQPQSGRYREFYQAGIEFLAEKADILQDFEVIEFAAHFLNMLGIHSWKLKLNFLGSPAEITSFSEALFIFFSENSQELSATSLERLKLRKPLRILDDKDEQSKSFFQHVPKISHFLTRESTQYFASLQTTLQKAGIEFEVDETLVRGLDYYTGVVFEFLDTSTSSSQNTLIGGGRYNHLVKSLGGPSLLGIGFGAGVERLMMAAPPQNISVFPKIFVGLSSEIIDIFLLDTLTLVRQLREHFLVDYNTSPATVSEVFKIFFHLKFDILILPQKDFQFFEVINKNKQRKLLDKFQLFEFLRTLEN